ncbi:MAG: hypothetical protein CL910_16860 [Deltaproteobacteria bacterium]|nr:hypothetical protein [Deltaproteobacteria bacterium]
MQPLRLVVKVRSIRSVVVVVLAWAWTAPASSQGVHPIAGVVRDEGGPVAHAVVRIQTTPHSTRTDSAGRFSIEAEGPGPWPLTAWAPGRFCAGPVEAAAGAGSVEILLEHHTASDHADYRWLTSLHGTGSEEEPGCADCHSREGTGLAFDLPVDQWRRDAHGRSARNPRFLTMYRGTDVEGRQSPPTRRVFVRDYGEQLLPPDPSQPYHGPGYKLDFPEDRWKLRGLSHARRSRGGTPRHRSDDRRGSGCPGHPLRLLPQGVGGQARSLHEPPLSARTRRALHRAPAASPG